MYVPILVLRDSIIVADRHDSAACLGFVQYAYQARQVELLVFAAQADPGDLQRQVVLVDRRSVISPTKSIRHTKTVGTFQVINQLSSRVRKTFPQPLTDRVGCQLSRVGIRAALAPAAVPWIDARRRLGNLVAGCAGLLPVIQFVRGTLLGRQTQTVQFFRWLLLRNAERR